MGPDGGQGRVRPGEVRGKDLAIRTRGYGQRVAGHASRQERGTVPGLCQQRATAQKRSSLCRRAARTNRGARRS